LQAENKTLNRKFYLLVVCIYISVFINSIVLFQEPFEFYIGYLIFLPLLPIFIFRHKVNSTLVGIFVILLFTGVFNIFLGNNTPQLFFKVFIGLFLSYLFYYYVIEEFNHDIEQLFKWYLKGAYFVSLIGLVQFISFQIGFEPGYNYSWIFNKWGYVTGGNFGIRVNSVFAEPTYLAATLSAAFFIAVYNLMRNETYYYSRLESVIIIAVYILSFSGLGQSGVFITFLLLAVNFGLVRYILIIIPVTIILFNVLYINVGEFRDRYDSLTGLFSGQEFKLGKTHGSSFVLYNNYIVTKESFRSNFMFGGGIGSHPVAFKKYSLAGKFKVVGFNNNSADANSMLLRLLSETGLFGVTIFVFIILKFYVRRDPYHDTFHWLVSNAILVMILLNLFRQGHYFLNGFPFFVLIYIYNAFHYQRITDHEEVKLALFEQNN
jgi:hypothetical protein